jgi:hypothetical protein
MEVICCVFACRVTLPGKRVCNEKKGEATHVSNSFLPNRKERQHAYQKVSCKGRLDHCSQKVFSSRACMVHCDRKTS